MISNDEIIEELEEIVNECYNSFLPLSDCLKCPLNGIWGDTGLCKKKLLRGLNIIMKKDQIKNIKDLLEFPIKYLIPEDRVNTEEYKVYLEKISEYLSSGGLKDD